MTNSLNFNDTQIALAVRLLDVFGVDATLIKSAAAASAPTELAQGFSKRAGRLVASSLDDTPVTPPQPAQTAVRTVVRPVTLEDENGQKVQRTRAILRDAVSAGDAITLGGDTYTITSVEVVKPLGVPIIYVAEVR